jgi:DNA-directed RNA polymerase subunit M/transcription elongation factor TFIIS
MFNLEDYEDVATLNRWFIENYPMGRSNLVTEFHDPVQGFIRVRAEIYRDSADANPAVTNIAFGARDLYNRNMARYYCEDTATSALGRAIILIKGSAKTATRESMEQVSVAQTEIAKVKAKMAETAKEYVPIAKEDDPWTIRDAEPAKTVDEAVAMVKDIIGGQTERDIPKCSKCHDHKEMTWRTGTGKNGKPYANFSCYTCKDIIWYEVSKEDGTWIPQKAKY